MLFKEIVGQPHITRTLTNAIKSDRVAHAYLFAGPRGVGKTSTARILARALNCEKGISPEPCNRCSSCIEIADGRNIDVLEIDGASNRGIDEIRELRSNVKFAPASAKFKIYIIDEVHMLTREAFNALLKTLEEPPSHIKFIFATTLPHKVPLTVLSRCQRFDFRRISSSEIAKRLEQIAGSEKIKIGREALSAIARGANGSLRDSEGILDQLVSFCDGEILVEDVNNLMGLVDEKVFFQLGLAIANGDTVSCINVINDIFNEGRDLEQFISRWQEHWKDILIAKMGKDTLSTLELTGPALERLTKSAEQFSTEKVFETIDLLSDVLRQMRISGETKTPLELAVIKLTQIPSHRTDPSPPPTDPLPQTDPPPRAGSPPQADLSPQEDPPLSESIISERWGEVLEETRKKKKTTEAFLREGKPIEISGETITVGFSKKFNFHREIIERPENKKVVEESLKKVFNRNLELKCVSVAHTPHKPIVERAQEIFGAEILTLEKKEKP